MADISILNPFCDDDEGERGKRGKRGKRGHRGEAGTAPPSIIPYASGGPVTLTHVVGGVADTGAVIGFGSSASSVAVVAFGAAIDLTGDGSGLLFNMAFSMPRDGTLTQLSAFFSNELNLELVIPANTFLVVQLYRSAKIGAGTPTNIFTPVPGALVELPLPAGSLAIGTFVSGTTALSVPVTNEDRLLLAARLIVTGTDAIISGVTGYISAGLAIA